MYRFLCTFVNNVTAQTFAVNKFYDCNKNDKEETRKVMHECLDECLNDCEEYGYSFISFTLNGIVFTDE